MLAHDHSPDPSKNVIFKTMFLCFCVKSKTWCSQSIVKVSSISAELLLSFFAIKAKEIEATNPCHLFTTTDSETAVAASEAVF
jgi:hypothetical protein